MSWPDQSFTEVRYTTQVKIRCFGCGHRLSRQRTFSATLPPGKHRFEVRQELRQQATRWNPQGLCRKCEQSALYVVLPDGSLTEATG